MDLHLTDTRKKIQYFGRRKDMEVDNLSQVLLAPHQNIGELTEFAERKYFPKNNSKTPNIRFQFQYIIR